MNAKELMIGDWVRHPELPYKIGKIDEIDNASRFVVIRDCDGSKPFSIELKRVEPIPLTEEILEANEFKCRKTYACPRYSYIDDKGHKLISFLRDRDGYEMQVGGNRVRLLYVHQLQHALRLCGLNDLADNFKLE